MTMDVTINLLNWYKAVQEDYSAVFIMNWLKGLRILLTLSIVICYSECKRNASIFCARWMHIYVYIYIYIYIYVILFTVMTGRLWTKILKSRSFSCLVMSAKIC